MNGLLRFDFPSIKWLLLLCFIYLVSSSTAISSADSPDETTSKYALMIAVTRYKDATMDATKLVYPETDAKSVGEYLAKGGFTVEYLLGAQATKQAIQAKLRAMSGRCSANGVAVVGLWGHGVEFAENGETMFCPHDTRLRALVDKDGRKLYQAMNQPLVEPDAASLVGLSEILAGLKISGAANRILLADCCRKSPNKTRAFGQSVTAADLPDNTLAILACKYDQEAFEHESWGHGAMTRALLETLPELGKAKSDFALNLVGPMTDKVSKMVHGLTKGKSTQTIHQISTGNPRLGLSPEQLLNSPALPAVESIRTQTLVISFQRPADMNISWLTAQMKLSDVELTTPARHSFASNGSYLLQLTNIPNFEGGRIFAAIHIPKDVPDGLQLQVVIPEDEYEVIRRGLPLRRAYYLLNESGDKSLVDSARPPSIQSFLIREGQDLAKDGSIQGKLLAIVELRNSNTFIERLSKSEQSSLTPGGDDWSTEPVTKPGKFPLKLKE